VLPSPQLRPLLFLAFTRLRDSFYQRIERLRMRLGVTFDRVWVCVFSFAHNAPPLPTLGTAPAGVRRSFSRYLVQYLCESIRIVIDTPMLRVKHETVERIRDRNLASFGDRLPHRGQERHSRSRSIHPPRTFMFSIRAVDVERHGLELDFRRLLF
jgi:hypothetical protein